jgi:TPR repeat protein
MVFVGVSVGGSAYSVVDLCFVGIGTYLAFKIHLGPPTDFNRHWGKNGSGPSFDARTELGELPTPPRAEQSLSEQRDRLVQTAERGDVAAQNFLAERLLDGESSTAYWRDYTDIWFPQDVARGLYWQQKAVENGFGSVNIRWLYDQESPDQEIVYAFANAYSELCRHSDCDEDYETSIGLRRVLCELSINNQDGSAASAILQAMRKLYFERHVKGTLGGL